MTPPRFDHSLFAESHHARRGVLMLDYDGTLAPFRLDRMSARPYPSVTAALEELARATQTHVAIVTGRPLTELRELLDPPDGLDLWGAHGWERINPQGVHTVWPQPEYCTVALGQARSRIGPFVPAGALETKQGAIVVHTRALGNDEHDRIHAAVREHWTPIAGIGDGLEWREFNRGFEFRVTLRTKGTVVRMLREETTEESHLAYLGDDLTDEDAFSELPPPDWSILVAPEPRETRARWWITTPGELLLFLQNWTSRFT